MMTGSWFDDAAKRAARGGSGSRRKLFTDGATRLTSRTPDRSALDELAASAAAPLSRRRSLKWGLKAALAFAAAPAATAALAEFAYAEPILTLDQIKELGDDTIIGLVDKTMFEGAELAGQELEPFGLLGAAIVFYEASEVLDSEPSSAPPGGCQPPDVGCGRTGCCQQGDICCMCHDGFCLIAGDCNDYC